jgi:hypothetical protein
MPSKDKEYEAQDFTKNVNLCVNGDCCMRQIYGRAGKKKTEPKGFFWRKGYKNTKRCHIVAELEMGR